MVIEESDRRTSANSVQSLEEQVSRSVGGLIAQQQYRQGGVRDGGAEVEADLNSKNSAFHYSVVSHKGRQL